MNPKEKLPIISDNMNSINFRPQTANPSTENEALQSITSREAGNEVRRAIESFELKLARDNNFH
jgi:hypothetical protein